MLDNVTQLPQGGSAEPKKEESKRRTITLTNRAPISITEANWPVVAEGQVKMEDCEAPITWGVSVKVRQDKAGRSIIHAKYYHHDDVHEVYDTVRVGRILGRDETAGNLSKNMLEVADEMRERIRSADMRIEVMRAFDACFESMKPHFMG